MLYCNCLTFPKLFCGWNIFLLGQYIWDGNKFLVYCLYPLLFCLNHLWEVLILYFSLFVIFPHLGEEASVETVPKFSPFTGAGRRLDGKSLTYQSPPVSSQISKEEGPGTSHGNNRPSASSSSQDIARQAQGKLVFGSNVSRPKETKQVSGVFFLFFLHHPHLIKLLKFTYHERKKEKKCRDPCTVGIIVSLIFRLLERRVNRSSPRKKKSPSSTLLRGKSTHWRANLVVSKKLVMVYPSSVDRRNIQDFIMMIWDVSSKDGIAGFISIWRESKLIYLLVNCKVTVEIQLI